MSFSEASASLLDRPRGPLLVTLLLSAALGAGVGRAEAQPPSTYVICFVGSGEVVVSDEPPAAGSDRVMKGPLPGPRTAEIWLEENCPDRRCRPDGGCATAAGAEPATGWRVLCSLRSGDVGLVNAAPPRGFSEMAGPFAQQTDAQRWIDTNCPDRRCDAAGGCESTPDAPAVEHPSTGQPATDAGATATTRGILVTGARSGSLAAQAGFVRGDLILMLNGTEVNHPDQVRSVYNGLAAGRTMLCWVERGDQVLHLSVRKRSSELGLEMSLPMQGNPVSRDHRASDWTVGGTRLRTAAEYAGSSATAGGGWVTGELTSVSSSDPNGAPTTSSGVVGPRSAAPDVSQLISAAALAVEACSFTAAYANADHMTNFTPDHVWLSANRDRLQALADRQLATEQQVWRASSLIEKKEFKKARSAARMAADTAVSCQSDVVSILLARIDELIAHRKAERSAATRRAAGQLLAGLLVFNKAMTAQQGSSTGSISIEDLAAAMATPMLASGSNAPGADDACSFKYEFRSKWSTEPSCTCPGYHFEAAKFRCVPGG